VISSSQRPLPDNTRHSQQTNIHAPGGIRTQDLSRRVDKPLGCCHENRVSIRMNFKWDLWCTQGAELGFPSTTSGLQWHLSLRKYCIQNHQSSREGTMGPLAAAFRRIIVLSTPPLSPKIIRKKYTQYIRNQTRHLHAYKSATLIASHKLGAIVRVENWVKIEEVTSTM